MKGLKAEFIKLDVNNKRKIAINRTKEANEEVLSRYYNEYLKNKIIKDRRCEAIKWMQQNIMILKLSPLLFCFGVMWSALFHHS